MSRALTTSALSLYLGKLLNCFFFYYITLAYTLSDCKHLFNIYFFYIQYERDYNRLGPIIVLDIMSSLL